MIDFSALIAGAALLINWQIPLFIGLAIGASAFGGSISYVGMLVIMYSLAAFAVKFGPPELFMLAIFGLTIIASLKGESLFSCNTLKSLACSTRLISPISSRNIVPLFAILNRPSFGVLFAPVKDPGSWPKSSFSKSSVGKAAQFTATRYPPAL